MRFAAAAWFVLLAPVFAGCLAPEPDAAYDGLDGAAVPPLVAVDGGVRPDERTVLWNVTSGADVPVTVTLPDGFWEANVGVLEVSILWDRFSDAEYAVQLLDANGDVVATGVNPPDFADHGVGSVALLPEAPSGTYAARIEARSGSAAVWGVAQIDARPRDAEPADLLPDLVPLAPTRLTLERQGGGGDVDDALPRAMVEATAGPGCYFHESAEGRAERCLRFSTGVANAGLGAIEVRTSPDQFALSPTPLAGATQRIYRTDGTHRDVPAGPTTFHAMHNHLHYDRLAAFDLYAWDEATGERGELVRTGQKAGMCFGDEGVVRLGLYGTAGRLYGWDGCLEYFVYFNDPARLANGNVMGLSPGWYDEYDAWQPDQYLDVGGVPDGTYELVFSVNGAGSLEEADRANNEASTFLRLTGDAVEELGSRGGW